jgi:hypothetical protein
MRAALVGFYFLATFDPGQADTSEFYVRTAFSMN